MRGGGNHKSESFRNLGFGRYEYAEVIPEFEGFCDLYLVDNGNSLMLRVS